MPRTENGMKVEFVIEVRDTYSNAHHHPFWRCHMSVDDPANPSTPALKLAEKFAKKRAKSVLGKRCDEDNPDDSRICIKTEWQIVKKVTTTEVVDMGSAGYGRLRDEEEVAGARA